MLADDSYLTLSSLSQGIYREKGSKFIGLACPIFSEGEIKEQLSKWRKEYYDASHHCYAYKLGKDRPVYRVNDDGEPSGSAGKPIYGQILSKEITNVLIVVIRYYGGTKLGIPGLINAYRTAAKDAIDNGNIILRTLRERYRIVFSYPSINEVMKILKESDVTFISQFFDNDCKIEFSIRRNSGEKVKSRLHKIDGLTMELFSTS
ncbi:MAG: YigZ family protein [Bacteroidetes bacterium]|nr:YigZ family protein [Bacteroidota bacterium]